MPEGVCLDLAGVLYEGDTAVPGAVAAVDRLRAAGLPLRFLTNSTRRPRRAILARLAALGFDVAPEELFTPATAAMARLRAEGLQPHLLIHPNLAEDFAGAPEAGKRAVVVGDAGPFFDFQRLNAAFRELDRGAVFLALAANRVFRDADGARSMDAGAFVAALEYATGREAEVIGKPARAYFHAACASMGLAPERVVMVGDDAEADVAGALKAGLGAALLVRTGKYSADDEARVSPSPSAVLADIGAAVDWILNR
jgi:HAD superfamily hydrolase (TIGR01458 family)